MRSFFTISIILTALFSGCLQPDTPVQEPEVYRNLSVQMPFESDLEEERMKELDKCIDDITDSSWRFVGYKDIGNFFEKRWCTGEGARDDCQIAGSTDQRKDQHVITLNTFSYSGGVLEYFGLGVHALKNPEDAGWGVSFSFVENSKSITNDQSSITFSYFESGGERPKKSISLGSNLGFQVYEKSVNLGLETPPREELEKFLASPESMRDYGLIQLNEHENEVYGHITSNEAVRCEYGPYEGGGIPPACIERPITEGEREESLIGAQEYFSQKRSILMKDYEDMYATLMEAFPFESCWEYSE